MLYSFVNAIHKKIDFPKASAHCDIPCKIYDPSAAQIAVLTMIRLVDLINELNSKGIDSLKDQASLIRLVNEKEEHGFIVKEEIRVIWGDYFKKPQFEQIPGVHDLVHSIMLQSSKAKQHIDRDATVELLNLVNQFAEAFWKTKGIDTYTADCPYPPSEKVIYPKLN